QLPRARPSSPASISDGAGCEFAESIDSRGEFTVMHRTFTFPPRFCSSKLWRFPRRRLMSGRSLAIAFLSTFPLTAQTIQPWTLQVAVSNWVSYEGDTFEYAKFATSAAPVPAAPRRPFSTFIAIADIVNVNGKAVRGTLIFRTTRVYLSPTPIPGIGNSIADVNRATVTEWLFELLQTDGT